MRYGKFKILSPLVGTLLLSVVGLALVSAEPPTSDKPKSGQAAEAEHLIHEVHLPTQGIARLEPTQDSKVQGTLWLTQTAAGLQIKGEVSGLTPGLHGFHVHEFGDLTDPQGKSAGGHFNPSGEPHGGPDGDHRHAGDLGNIKADEEGTAKVNINAAGLKLHFVIGRSFVVHAGKDDLKSQPAGDSGDRVAVGVIGIAQSKEAHKPAAK